MLLASGSFSVSDALTSATSLFNWVLDCISSNPILLAAFVVTVLIPAGVMVFSRLTHSIS